MLKMIISGHIGKDAEVKEVGSNKAINFNVAVNMDHKDSNGNKVEKTEWVRAVLWKSEKQSMNIVDFLKKGQKVLIEGIPSSEGYKNKEGEVKSSLQINVKELELIN